MSFHYSDPSRENDKWALHDVEVFQAVRGEWAYDASGERCDAESDPETGVLLDDPAPNEPGFYFWFCFPGCLPDSDPFGPYPTEQDAVDAAQEMAVAS